MIDQCHNIEGKMVPMIYSVLNCQEAYAKALLVARDRLAAVQAEGKVLEAHHLLNDAYRTDVRPCWPKFAQRWACPPTLLPPIGPAATRKKSGPSVELSATSGGFQ